MPRRLTLGIVLFFLIAAVYSGGLWIGRVGESAPRFRTAEAKITDMVATISATGTVVPEDTIDVGTQVNGQIASFGTGADGRPVDYRSEVAEGSLLATIDDALYAADVATAEAQLAQAHAQVELNQANLLQAQARLDQAQRDWTRAQKLGGTEALAQVDYDALKSEHDQAVAAVGVARAQIAHAQAQVGIANASVTRARRNLAYCRITSPVSGVIIDKRVDIGQTVVANLSAPSLFLIAKDLRKMLVLVQVNEADVASIGPDTPVTFTVDAVPGRAFHGVVRKVRLNATMTQNVVTYTTEIAADNPDMELLPYLTASVRFVIGQRDQVLVVPNTALRFASGSTADEPVEPGADADTRRGRVWVLDDSGQPKLVNVGLGLSDGAVTEVHSDELAAGTRVIVGQDDPSSSAANKSVNPFAPQLFRR